MNNYFAGTAQYPYHISVGAVVRNAKGEIAAHHFKDHHGIPDCYTLMRETIEPNESLEQTLARGLMEEFGITARLLHALGARQNMFTGGGGIRIQKTTLYFALELLTQDEAKRSPDDREKDAINEWCKPDFLMQQIRNKAEQMGEGGVTEADIIERLVA